jgi:hypothetical protein
MGQFRRCQGRRTMVMYIACASFTSIFHNRLCFPNVFSTILAQAWIAPTPTEGKSTLVSSPTPPTSSASTRSCLVSSFLN